MVFPSLDDIPGYDFGTILMEKAERIRQLAVRKSADEIYLKQKMDQKQRLVESAPEPTKIEPGTLEWKLLEGCFAWIPETYAQFLEPDPATFDPLITSAREAEQRLNSKIMKRMAIVENYVSDWRGDAAGKFHWKFLNGFDSIVNHQHALASVLLAAIETNKKLYAKRRRNILAIAEQTVTSLATVHDCDGEDAAANLAVFSAVCGVIGAVLAPVTGGLSLSITFSVIAGGASAASAMIPPDEKKAVPISGDTVQEVVDNMCHAIDFLSDWVAGEERSMAKALRDNLDAVLDPANRKEIVPPRPTIIDLSPSELKAGFVPPA